MVWGLFTNHTVPLIRVSRFPDLFVNDIFRIITDFHFTFPYVIDLTRLKNSCPHTLFVFLILTATRHTLIKLKGLIASPP